MKLIIKTVLQVQIPIETVFTAIVNPKEMTQYFISKSSGVMEEGAEIIWEWPEFPGQKSIVNAIKIEKNRFISFVWDHSTTVEITLEEQTDQSVIVRITESEKELNEENLKWYAGNTEGWANFLACLKAYLEYGINLRTGSFEFLRTSNQNG